MKHSDPNRLREDLNRIDPPPPLPETRQFWADFRARAAQLQRSPGGERPASFWRRRPLLATACGMAAAAVLVLLAVLPALFSPSTPQGSEARPLSNVESLRVEGDYESLMIVEDRENGGTLIWMNGLQSQHNPQPRDEQS